jgi:hypothetical protein
MPYKIRKLNNQDLYKVTNTETGEIISKGTTLDKAKSQLRLLENLEDKKILKGGKMKIGDVKTLLTNSYNDKPNDVDNYTLDKSLSGKRVQVYTDKNGKAYVVHRGTQGIQDVFTDIKMTFGNIKGQKRFKYAEKIQKEAEKKYGKVTTLGHSLGARIAEEVGKKSKEIITYNKPTLPLDILKKLPDKQYDIRTSRDPVSILQPLQKGSSDLVINSKTINPFIEHSIDALDRLDKNIMVGSGLNIFNYPSRCLKMRQK